MTSQIQLHKIWMKWQKHGDKITVYSENLFWIGQLVINSVLCIEMHIDATTFILLPKMSKWKIRQAYPSITCNISVTFLFFFFPSELKRSVHKLGMIKVPFAL